MEVRVNCHCDGPTSASCRYSGSRWSIAPRHSGQLTTAWPHARHVTCPHGTNAVVACVPMHTAHSATACSACPSLACAGLGTSHLKHTRRLAKLFTPHAAHVQSPLRDGTATGTVTGTGVDAVGNAGIGAGTASGAREPGRRVPHLLQLALLPHTVNAQRAHHQSAGRAPPDMRTCKKSEEVRARSSAALNREWSVWNALLPN
jgi:hypothetical protein